MIGTCSLITGVPGAGKSLGWVKWLVDDYLMRPGGRVVTNIRLNVDAISDYVSSHCNTFFQRRFGYAPSSDDVSSRIILLTDDDCSKLRNSSDIPAFFGDIEDTYICLDEFHSFCYSGMSGLVLKSWADWLAVLRHHHASICAISQDVSQIDRVFKSRVESRVEFISSDSQHDPYLHIPLGDWCDLLSAISGKILRPNVRCIYRKSINGHWTVSHVRWDFIDSRFFGFYDSWQKGVSLQ